jgi:DNA-directed RNA polymerase specialized sigma24 family protein
MDNDVFNNQTEEELLAQWEPKVNSMLRTVSIVGLDREDIAQELRIAIIKSARRYHPENTTAKFHTYLHISMLNVIRSLIAKAQRRVGTTSLDKQRYDTSSQYPSNDPLNLADPSQDALFEAVDLMSVLENSDLTLNEMTFIALRTQKYRLKDISVLLNSNSVKLRENIKKKLGDSPHEQPV